MIYTGVLMIPLHSVSFHNLHSALHTQAHKLKLLIYCSCEISVAD